MAEWSIALVLKTRVLQGTVSSNLTSSACVLYYNAYMRLMAIDYGGKNVGIASTDEAGNFAIPRVVLPNDKDLLNTVSRLSEDWQIGRIIVGESLNYKNERNPIDEEAKSFAESLRMLGKTVEFHPELMTSLEAQHIQGDIPMLDASAAALILKSYIDTNRA